MPVKGGYQGYTGNYSADQVLGSTIVQFGIGSDSSQAAIQAVLREDNLPSIDIGGNTYYNAGPGGFAPLSSPPTQHTPRTTPTVSSLGLNLSSLKLPNLSNISPVFVVAGAALLILILK